MVSAQEMIPGWYLPLNYEDVSINHCFVYIVLFFRNPFVGKVI